MQFISIKMMFIWKKNVYFAIETHDLNLLSYEKHLYHRFNGADWF